MGVFGSGDWWRVKEETKKGGSEEGPNRGVGTLVIQTRNFFASLESFPTSHPRPRSRIHTMFRIGSIVPLE